MITQQEFAQLLSQGVEEGRAKLSSPQVGEGAEEAESPVVSEQSVVEETVSGASENGAEDDPSEAIRRAETEAALQFFREASGAKGEQLLELLRSHLGEKVAEEALSSARRLLADEYKEEARKKVIEELFGDAAITERELSAIQSLVKEGKLLEESEEAEKIKRLRALDEEIERRRRQLEEQGPDPVMQKIQETATLLDKQFERYMDATHLKVEPTDDEDSAAVKNAFRFAVAHLVAQDKAVVDALAAVRTNIQVGRPHLNDKVLPEVIRLIERRTSSIINRLQNFQPSAKVPTPVKAGNATLKAASPSVEDQYKDIVDRVFSRFNYGR